MLISITECKDGVWAGRPDLGYWCNTKPEPDVTSKQSHIWSLSSIHTPLHISFHQTGMNNMETLRSRNLTSQGRVTSRLQKGTTKWGQSITPTISMMAAMMKILMVHLMKNENLNSASVSISNGWVDNSCLTCIYSGDHHTTFIV